MTRLGDAWRATRGLTFDVRLQTMGMIFQEARKHGYWWPRHEHIRDVFARVRRWSDEIKLGRIVDLIRHRIHAERGLLHERFDADDNHRLIMHLDTRLTDAWDVINDISMLLRNNSTAEQKEQIALIIARTNIREALPHHSSWLRLKDHYGPD